MEVKDWLEHPVTIKVLDRIWQERANSLEVILNSSTRDESSGIAIGITMIYNLIKNLEERDLRESS